MTYPRIYKNNLRKGSLLFDAILGLSLAAILSALMSFSIFQTRQIYVHAQNRSALLSAYLNAASTTSFLRLYGNDMTERIITVSGANDQLQFSQVRAATSSESESTSMCSVDLGDETTVGSYQYFHSATNTPLRVVSRQINLPISPTIPLTDLIVRNGIAYISADSSNSSDPDLFIVDIHDPPRLLSVINTGPGLVAVALKENYIFGAASSIAAQLHVVRVDSLSSLRLMKKYQLPLPEASTSPPIGSAIAINGNLLVLGTEKWDGDELSFIDISNPSNPIKISGINTDGKVNDISVHNNVAYVSASDQNQLRVADVSRPSSPVLLSAFDPSGWTRQDGKVSRVFENELLFGRTSGGFNIATDKELFWFNNGSSTPLNTLDISGGIYGIVIDRNHAYVGTHTADKEFAIYDRNLATSTAIYVSLPVQPQRLTCDGSRIYLLAKNSPTLYEIRIYSD